METTQMLWGVNSLLIVILGFVVKSWISSVTKKIGCKQDKVVCAERYPKIEKNIDGLFTHKHPLNDGERETGGVIIP